MYFILKAHLRILEKMLSSCLYSLTSITKDSAKPSPCPLIANTTIHLFKMEKQQWLQKQMVTGNLGQAPAYIKQNLKLE